MPEYVLGGLQIGKEYRVLNALGVRQPGNVSEAPNILFGVLVGVADNKKMFPGIKVFVYHPYKVIDGGIV